MTKTKPAVKEARAVALDKEEQELLAMYRRRSRWEKNAIYLLMVSLADGQMVPEKTDHLSWDQVKKRLLQLPDSGKGVTHG